MFSEPGVQHFRPHFHAYYQNQAAAHTVEPDEEEQVMHPIYRVVGFDRVGPYVLQVRFDDGSEQVIDFSPVLVGPLYGPLEDEPVFSQVAIDPEMHTLVWPNGADFDPATLHDWPRYAHEMKHMAERWRQTQAATSP